MKRLLVFLLGTTLLAGPVLGPAPVFAQKATSSTKSAAQKKTAKNTTAKKQVAKSSSRKPTVRKKARVKKRVTNGVRRTQMESERISQIQNGLAREGFLKDPITGKWDRPTEQAMADYQRENGFKVTGKPDAKSLKKLGL